MNEVAAGPTNEGAAEDPQRWARPVFWAGLVAVVAVFFAGAWQRRWIADDGLIVLRTVRNLIAGNGPVFNAGERVESNTSTLWTYVIYFTHEVTGGRLELVVLGVALALNVDSIMAGVNYLSGGGAWDPAVRGIYRLPAELRGIDIARAVGLSLTLSFIVTIFPARRAARMNPVEALRYE